MMLVTLERCKSALGVTHDEQDADITLYIEAASEVLIGWAKSPAWASDDPIAVPKRFELACISLVGIYLREIDGDEQKLFGKNELPLMVTAILAGDRTPTLA